MSDKLVLKCGSRYYTLDGKWSKEPEHVRVITDLEQGRYWIKVARARSNPQGKIKLVRTFK